ncbi:MAG: cadherin-like domain-containing protein [Nanoarchaeota archaeon]|nr:cadherin-like domain-containing protein [Nanoarchaeota archaeon]
MRQSFLILLLFFSILWLTSIASAVPTALNIMGTISGTCSASADVSIYGYCPGQVGNASCSIDNSTVVASGAGVYATSLTYDNGVYPTGIDVLVVADNSSCSTGASGTNTRTNAVGGGPAVTINVVMSNLFTLDTPANGSVVTSQNISFAWTNNIVTPNSTIQIDDNSGFASVDVSQSNIATSSVTIPTALLDGTYYWRVITYIGSTLIQQSGVNNFILANNTPSIVSVSPNATTWISATSTTLSLTTDIAATCAYATTSGVSFASKTTFSSTGTTAHSTTVSLPSNGGNNFYVQCNSSGGNLMPADTLVTINRDTSAPSASGAIVSINSGAAYATNTTVNVSWSGFTDVVSSVTGYYINTTNNQGTALGVFTSGSSVLLSGLSQGTITAYVWAVDAAGNIGSAASDSIIVDSQAPTYGSWSSSPVNLNLFTISDFVVYVTVSDTSSLSGLPQLSYAIGADAFTTPADMTLVSGSNYMFTIPNQAAPNNWATRAGENLTYTVNATDARGFSSSASKSIFINNNFNAPTFSAIASQQTNQGTNFSLFLQANDIDGDTLVFSSNNSAITISSINASSATAYWTPDNDDVGTNVVIFTVTDGYFNVSQAVIITVLNVNDVPVFTTIPDLSAYEYEEFTYTINASDPDNDILIFSSDSDLFVISSSGSFTFTPTASQRGEHEIHFTVDDGNGGVTTTNITFTVLYCGDDVCSEEYESSDSCLLDCELDESSQGFIIGSKTCLGDTLEIQAVELVPRTTCPSKGIIINGWESCENVSDTTVNIEQDIQDTYVVIASLITDENGMASFTPNETGDYRVRYDSADFDENIVYFGINKCSAKDSTVLESSGDSNQDSSDDITLPLFEEPLSQEQIVKLSKATKFLYFALLPLLFILISVAAVSTYYRYDRQKGSGNFSKELDMLLSKINGQMLSLTRKVLGSKTYQQMKPYVKLLSDQWIQVKQTTFKAIEPLIKTKQVSVPFYGDYLGTLSEEKLLLQSAYDFKFKGKNSEQFTQALFREQLLPATNLRSFCLNAHQLGMSFTYLFSATKQKEELLSLHEKVTVKKSYPTLTDMKRELLKGNIVALPLHMNSLNKAAPKKNFIALLIGYNKNGFFMLDYSFSRKKKTFIPLGALQNAWNATGYLECAIFKK